MLLTMDMITNRDSEKYKYVVIYGAGKIGRKCLEYIHGADYFCDKNAADIGKIDNVPCITRDELLSKYKGALVILAIADYRARKELHDFFVDKEDFLVCDFVDSLDRQKYKYNCEEKDKLHIHIVCDNDGWILGKFAQKLKEELVKLGQDVSVSDSENPEADINHYVSYRNLNEIPGVSNTHRTTMITHVDNTYKKDLIRLQCEYGTVAICMSRDTMNKLVSWGVEPNNVCYINPAHDNEMKPKKISLGITNNCYSGTQDFRKNDAMILSVMSQVDVSLFKLTIMGRDWDDIVDKLRDMGLEVDYYNDFIRDEYYKLMPSLDYWLYYGFDEGAMGYLDALSAGVKTIVTPQGYHLDAPNGLTYPCRTISDFADVLNKIAEEKKCIIDAVKDWTWDNYAKKHLEVWQYMTKSKPLGELFKNQSKYDDGIFSLLIDDNAI